MVQFFRKLFLRVYGIKIREYVDPDGVQVVEVRLPSRIANKPSWKERERRMTERAREQGITVTESVEGDGGQLR
jgi:hypothetical protein